MNMHNPAHPGGGLPSCIRESGSLHPPRVIQARLVVSSLGGEDILQSVFIRELGEGVFHIMPARPHGISLS